MKEQDKAISRRSFVGTVGAVGAIGALGSMMASCTKTEQKKKVAPKVVEWLDKAPDGEPLKAGLIGCGGRGTGAAMNFLNAGPNLSITALADVFEDRLNGCRKKLVDEGGQDIPDANCFVGFDAYQRLIDTGVDIVLIATPPHFRPMHFAACVNARKHVFMEKPVAVDPVGARSIMTSAKKADGVDLCVVTGTQRRHQRDYVATYHQIESGAIGEIVAANCYWNQNQLWYRTKQDNWSDMEYMLRDWVSWGWLSGDHIVEQHVHNLDVINWFTGKHPVKAVGFGGRHRRVTGDQFDFFSVDYVFDDKMHSHSMCRQINGCATNVSEFIMGSKGSTNCRNTIFKPDGTVAWEYAYPPDESGKPMKNVKISPYDQEHIDLVTAIRTKKPINEAEGTAISTLTAIMGRISAYTGKETTWDEMMSSDLRIGPVEYAMGPVAIEAAASVPGSG